MPSLTVTCYAVLCCYPGNGCSFLNGNKGVDLGEGRRCYSPGRSGGGETVNGKIEKTVDVA